MARAGLKIVDPAGTRYSLNLAPSGKGGRGFTLITKPWETGDPKVPFRIPLHPWDGGLRTDRLSLHVSPYSGVLINRATSTYAKGNCDASNEGLLLFPPLVTSVALTNGVNPTKFVEFDSKIFAVDGRYMYYFDPVTNTATLDKDFGASKGAVDAEPFNSQLVVAMGETEKLYTRSIGSDVSGTADAAVTSDATSLTDTRLALTVNGYIGATVTCNAKTMVVTSNTATVFTGASWSGGGTPGNGNAWSVAGTWTQATDATYAIALAGVDNKLWRAESTNKLTSTTITPRTLSNWTPASPNQYPVGDTTYPVHANGILDYGGVLWAGADDGMYSPDPAARFHNQTPQLRRWPDNGRNCTSSFTAWGFLWVPSAAGLIRIKPGSAVIRGPEITGRPGFRWQVRGGVEFGGVVYLLCQDLSGVSETCIVKMMKDTGQGDNEYVYHEWARLGSTTAGYAITVSTKGTNPELIIGHGATIKYIKLGRGGGRDIDDSNYSYGTAMVMETGGLMTAPDLSVLVVFGGVTTLLDYSGAGESLSLDYKFDSGTYYPLLSSQEGGGYAPIQLTQNYESVVRYAPPNTSGQVLEVRATGALTSASGTNRPEIREMWAFGYVRPRVTDVISVAIHADGRSTGANGMRNGLGVEETERLFRNWMNTDAVLEVELERYETGRAARFLVTDVKMIEQDASVNGGSQIADQVLVELTRTPFDSNYAVRVE